MAATAVAAQNTTKLSATKAGDYGIVYNLPSTVIDITLEAECTIERPGEFWQYAKIYLNAEPIKEQSSRWSLKSAILSTEGIADAEEEYLVQLKSGNAPFIIVNEEKVPLAVNSEKTKEPAKPKLPAVVEAKPTILESQAAAHAVTADMIASTSLAKRAELAAAKIYELRDTRNEILSGQSDNMPADGEAMRLVLNNLAEQEEALTAMFLGTRQTKTQVQTFAYLPTAEQDTTAIVARLSVLKGIVPPDDLSGEPIYLDYRVVEKGTVPMNEKGEPRRFPKGGFAYRVPGKADIRVTCDDRVYASLSARVAQLGVVFGIEPALFTDRKAPAYLILDPTTGAIVELGTVNLE